MTGASHLLITLSVAAVLALMLTCFIYAKPFPAIVGAGIGAIQDSSVGVEHAEVDTRGVGTLFICTHAYPLVDFLVALELVRKRQARHPDAALDMVAVNLPHTKIYESVYTSLGALRDTKIIYMTTGTVGKVSEALQRGRHVMIMHADRKAIRSGPFHIQKETGCRVVLVKMPDIADGFPETRVEPLLGQPGRTLNVHYEEIRFDSWESYCTAVERLYLI